MLGKVLQHDEEPEVLCSASQVRFRAWDSVVVVDLDVVSMPQFVDQSVKAVESVLRFGAGPKRVKKDLKMIVFVLSMRMLEKVTIRLLRPGLEVMCLSSESSDEERSRGCTTR